MIALNSDIYQVGGSLSPVAPSYVQRQADEALNQALAQGEFCYILDSRQMGKSSLLVRAQTKIKQAGARFVSLDLTTLGSQNVTAQQWYRGIGAELCLGFELMPMTQFLAWWREQGDLPMLQILSRLIDQVLLARHPNTPLYIFVDEVDSVLSLPFAADDWFALIRYCYNQRALDPRYNRITFAIAGVATPSDLIRDKTRTPFNIGRSIPLRGVQTQETAPLAAGLQGMGGDAIALMRAVLSWTGGQPFLTQKLCWLLVDESDSSPVVGREAEWVNQVVGDRILHHWESQDEPEHLRTIRDRLLRNEQRAGRLLGLYQKLLSEPVPTDDSTEQTELLLSGLVIQTLGQLQVKNRIYQAIFDAEWVTQQLVNLRPYSQNLDAWIASQRTDSSRLLQGQALQDAQQWAIGKSLAEADYQFLTASEALDRQTERQKLEAARAQEAESRLREEQRAAKLQRRLLGVVSLALLATVGFGLTAFWQYRQAVTKGQQAAQETVRTLATSAEAQLASGRGLDALVAAVRAHIGLNQLPANFSPGELRRQVAAILRQTIVSAAEVNRLTGHTNYANDVAFSPDGNALVSVSPDGTLKFWGRNGALIRTVQVTEEDIYAVDYGAGLIAIAEGTNAVQLWSTAGEQVRSLTGHAATVWFVTFDPSGELIASASQDSTVRLWSSQGQLLQSFQGHAPVFGADISPDQQLIASASTDGTAKIWRRDGQLQATLTGHEGPVWAVAFSPSDDLVVTTGQDQTVRLWRTDGTPVKTLRGHSGGIWGVKFSPDGSFFVSTSVDETAKVWSSRGHLLDTLSGHEGTVWGVDISPDGDIATASWDQTVRLWRRPNPLQQTIQGFEGAVSAIAYDRAGDLLASASADGAVRLWRRGELVKTLSGSDAEATSVAISPDTTYIVSSGANSARVWTQDGVLRHTLTGHQDEVYAVAIGPDSETIATGSIDGIVKLWDRQGRLKRTIDIGQSIYSLEISPDGQTLATTGSKGHLQLWNLRGEMLRKIQPEDAISRVAFHPQGQTLAALSAAGIELYSVTGDRLQLIPLDPDEFSSLSNLAFSTDGSLLAATMRNTRLKIWQIKLWSTSGIEVGNLFTDGSITDLAFNPDGKTLASSANQRIRLWNLEQLFELDDLALACGWIKDYLQTSSEVAEGDRGLCDHFLDE